MGIFSRDVPNKVISLISFLSLLLFLPILVYGVVKFISLYGRATGVPADITVDSKKIINPVRTDFYHALAQGGEEQNNMLANLTSEVRNLRPKYIRIDHIYDYYNIVSKNGDQLSFDFSRLDQVVDTILATGALPFISLSYMPPAIAKDSNVINPPDNWNDWSLVVQKTIEHYSGKSERNLKNIHYEVWNEPDLAQFGSWKTYGDKNYLTLYAYAAAGASRAANCNSFFIGGPSTTGLYKNWINALVNSHNRVDFLSWHTYNENPTDFIKDQQNLTFWLIDRPSYLRLPRIITEFGPTGSKDQRYGTNYLAAYTAAVIRQLINSGPKYLFSFQIKDGPGQLDNAGWGIFAHEDQNLRRKPRYYIYNFLDEMTGSLVEVKGEGSWVTSYAAVDGSTVRVLFVNLDQKQMHTETFPVRIINLDPGLYKWKIDYLFSGGCAIDYPTGNIFAQENVNAGIFTKTICLPFSNVAILELTKI